MYGLVITIVVCGTVIILAAMGFNCCRYKYRCKLKIERLKLRKMNQSYLSVTGTEDLLCRKSTPCSHKSGEQHNGTFTGFYMDADGNMIPVEPSRSTKKSGRS